MSILYPLTLPSFNHKIKKISGKTYILDLTRKKYLLLTPEEWVRQHLLNYLINHCCYPRGLLQTERNMQGAMRCYRPDIVFWDKEGNPKMLIECKAPYITLHHQALSQLLQYQRTCLVRFLALTNGITHFCWKLREDTQQWHAMEHLPTYQELMYNAP